MSHPNIIALGLYPYTQERNKSTRAAGAHRCRSYNQFITRLHNYTSVAHPLSSCPPFNLSFVTNLLYNYDFVLKLYIARFNLVTTNYYYLL